MNRRVAARVVPGLLLVTLVLAGCCNENWKGVGTVSGTLTITGSWDLGEYDAITVQSVDNCDNKYVHFSARDSDLNAIRQTLINEGTYTVDLEEQEVIAGKVLTRWMVRGDEDFRMTFDTRWSVEYKLKKNGEKVVAITYAFPESGSR
ncbi:hypothetical protein ACFL3X_01200 [Gemmatimonadota bacterium]